MSTTEARNNIRIALRHGLITEEEAREANRRISNINARNISWKQKAALRAIWA